MTLHIKLLIPKIEDIQSKKCVPLYDIVIKNVIKN
jgi:hypothetical protein